jgi:hypothetical protein
LATAFCLENLLFAEAMGKLKSSKRNPEYFIGFSCQRELALSQVATGIGLAPNRARK